METVRASILKLIFAEIRLTVQRNPTPLRQIALWVESKLGRMEFLVGTGGSP